jgi:hypothetical protein
MKIKVTKYLYLQRKTRYSKIGARVSSNKGEIRKNEICLKLDLDLDEEVFTDSIPTVTLDSKGL